MAFRRGLKSQSTGGTGVSPVQAQAKACGYKKMPFERNSVWLSPSREMAPQLSPLVPPGGQFPEVDFI